MARLLLIDDDRSLLELLSGFLAPQGFAVTTADGGRAGLRALYADHPDLIVLDVSMPEKDGWETLKAIRDLSPAPVIMLTARGDEADVLRGFRSAPMTMSPNRSLLPNFTPGSARCSPAPVTARRKRPPSRPATSR